MIANTIDKMLVKIPSIYSKQDLVDNSPLQYAFIKINDLCNAKCAFCDVWKKQINFAKGIDWNKIIDELGQLGVKHVNVHGGEVFLSKPFFPMIERAHKEIKFSITTNGILLDNFYDRLFSSNVKRLYISIDHFDPSLNAKSREIKKLEPKLFPIIKRITNEQKDVEVVVNHVVSSFNIETIDSMVYTMKNLGVSALNLIPIKDYPALNVTIEQIKLFYEKIHHLFDEKIITQNYFLNGVYKIFGDENAWGLAAQGNYMMGFKKACLIPSTTLFVDGPTGHVYPCDTTLYRKNSEDYIMGNVLKNNLHDIWHGELFKLFRKRMYPKITCSCIQGCDPANVIVD